MIEEGGVRKMMERLNDRCVCVCVCVSVWVCVCLVVDE